MEVKNMSMTDIEARSAEIEKQIVDGSDADFSAEIEELEARKAQIEKEAEERKALLNEVEKTSVEVETRKEENMNYKDTQEYIDAYARYIKTGDDRECRALMTENAEDGTLPVPTFVADIVAGEFKRSEIVDGFRHMRVKGNVRVPVEQSAPAADIHMEGGEGVNEENLVIANVMLNPITYKKWVGITDEALDIELMSSRSYLEYVFEEIARGILKAREDEFIRTVVNRANDTTIDTGKLIVSRFQTAGIFDFVRARASLSSDARDLVAIVNPSSYAKYRTLQLSAGYPIDVFDGMKVIVKEFPQILVGFADATPMAIVGDLRGYMENLPNGEEIQFKKDDLTLMTQDVTRILGRLPASTGLVGNKYFCVIMPADGGADS